MGTTNICDVIAIFSLEGPLTFAGSAREKKEETERDNGIRVTALFYVNQKDVT